MRLLSETEIGNGLPTSFGVLSTETASANSGPDGCAMATGAPSTVAIVTAAKKSERASEAAQE